MAENKSGWLYEISFMRPILLVLLVSYHAFAPFCGAWEMPIGIEDNCFYKWLAYLSRAFRLEAFVFLSGYVFTMQIVTKNKFKSLKQLAISKFRRLIIPCWIFGIVYYLIFSQDKSLFLVFNGIGHLWYLPCLFWCFLFSYYINKKDLSNKLVIFILFALLAASTIQILPFQISRAFYYLFFFQMGSDFYKNKEYLRTITNAKNISILASLFLILLISVNIYNEFTILLLENTNIIEKVGILFSKVIAKATLATVGISMLYLFASMYMKNHTLNKNIMTIGTMGYGVYIFHQFILKHLYYYTELPSITGTIVLPWIALVSTIILSLLLTHLFRSTKIGRALI